MTDRITEHCLFTIGMPGLPAIAIAAHQDGDYGQAVEIIQAEYARHNPHKLASSRGIVREYKRRLSKQGYSNGKTTNPV